MVKTVVGKCLIGSRTQCTFKFSINVKIYSITILNYSFHLPKHAESHNIIVAWNAYLLYCNMYHHVLLATLVLIHGTINLENYTMNFVENHNYYDFEDELLHNVREFD